MLFPPPAHEDHLLRDLRTLYVESRQMRRYHVLQQARGNLRQWITVLGLAALMVLALVLKSGDDDLTYNIVVSLFGCAWSVQRWAEEQRAITRHRILDLFWLDLRTRIERDFLLGADVMATRVHELRDDCKRLRDKSVHDGPRFSIPMHEKAKKQVKDEIWGKDE